MRINFSPDRASKSRPWLIELIKRFAEAYDISTRSGTKVKSYLATPTGARTFATWMKSQGFQVEYWCLEPWIRIENTYNTQRKITEYLAFGIIVDDDCPRFVELKLRHA